jgi:hypothetical protein
MKGHVRRFTKDEVRAARKEDRLEELATWGLQKDSIEWAAEKCMPCLQRHFNDLEEHTPEDQAARDEITRQLNEQALEAEGKVIFSYTYTLSFRITDPNKPVKRFEEMFKEKDKGQQD